VTALPFVGAHELRAQTPPEPDWRWTGYVAPGAVTILGGKPKAGKSTLALALAEAVATEAPTFLGRAVDVTVTTPTEATTTRPVDWFTYLQAAPTCLLRPQSDRLAVGKSSKKVKQGNHRKAGTVALIAICNQNANGTLKGAVRLVGKKGKHGKQRTKVFQLGTVHAALKAGVATGLKLKLPAALVLAVEPGTKGSAAFTLTASSANGTSGATARIPSLKL